MFITPCFLKRSRNAVLVFLLMGILMIYLGMITGAICHGDNGLEMNTGKNKDAACGGSLPSDDDGES